MTVIYKLAYCLLFSTWKISCRSRMDHGTGSVATRTYGKIEVSDYDTLEQFSELVALLPDSNHLRPLVILTEISRSMQLVPRQKVSFVSKTIKELPDLDEDEHLTETLFVQGSGGGGQKINKTSSIV